MTQTQHSPDVKIQYAEVMNGRPVISDGLRSFSQSFAVRGKSWEVEGKEKVSVLLMNRREVERRAEPKETLAGLLDAGVKYHIGTFC